LLSASTSRALSVEPAWRSMEPPGHGRAMAWSWSGPVEGYRLVVEVQPLGRLVVRVDGSVVPVRRAKERAVLSSGLEKRTAQSPRLPDRRPRPPAIARPTRLALTIRRGNPKPHHHRRPMAHSRQLHPPHHRHRHNRRRHMTTTSFSADNRQIHSPMCGKQVMRAETWMSRDGGVRWAIFAPSPTRH
jgi:hypothetical protein